MADSKEADTLTRESINRWLSEFLGVSKAKDAWAVIDVFTRQRSMEMVDRAMDDDRDEPENFILLLLLLHDHSSEVAMQTALMNLIGAAFSLSIVHSQALSSYLESLRARCPTGKEVREDEG